MANFKKMLSENYGLVAVDKDLYLGDIGGFYTTVSFNKGKTFVLSIGINFAGEAPAFDEFLRELKSIYIIYKKRIANYVKIVGGSIFSKKKQMPF